MDHTHLHALMRKVIDRRREYEKASAAKTAAGKAKAAAEIEVFEALETMKQNSTGLVDLGQGYGKRRFTRRATDYAQVLDLERAKEAMLAEGYDEAAIVGEKLREKPLNELVRERLENHQELPDGIEFYTRRGVTVSSR
jgi:hypothetical protein